MSSKDVLSFDVWIFDVDLCSAFSGFQWHIQGTTGAQGFKGAGAPRWLLKQIGIEPGGSRGREQIRIQRAYSIVMYDELWCIAMYYDILRCVMI